MTGLEHDDILELLALYALDGLEPAERDGVASHLAGCPSCEAEAARLLALVSAVAASVPPRAPDPALRAKVLQRATGRAAQPARVPARQPATSPRRAGLSVWLARATITLALGLIIWNILLTFQLRNLSRQVERGQAALALISAPDTAEIALAGEGEYAGAQGKAYVDPQSARVVLVVQHLRPLTAERTYQAWIITDAGAMSAGLFRVSDSGMAIAWLDAPYTSGGVIGVSLEPAGGSAQPTLVVLVGSG